ncbi:MAG: MFS transporter [Candidatus Binataceae bacterium]
MKSDKHRGWVIVASLFITLFLIFGSGYDTSGVFFAPMLKDFGWSRTRLSSLQTAFALAIGVTGPLVGWVLDRIEARAVMAIGVVFAGTAFMLISQANSFGLLLVAYVVLGVGLAAATLLPCSVVIANWFGERRGEALGIVIAGTSFGGMVMTLVAARVVAVAGWRAGFVVLALPMFLIALPLVLMTVSTRPPGEKAGNVSDTASALPGLDVGQALHARSFWMIAVAQFCYSFAGAGATVHTVPYLVLMGYNAERAAQVWGITFGLASLGKPLFGYVADYLTGSKALAISLALAAFGQFLLLDGKNGPMLGGYTLIYGLTSGAPLALIPMLISQSLGLKRFGSVTGVTGIPMMAGVATGPLIAGWIFDRGYGYGAAFALFAVALGAGAVAAALCSPLVESESLLAASNE